ncbi:MAG: hypothetical protein D6818_03370 [Bacteroidetes bacterium]|nr:MAG: hypothetical protein D6818_03370 [Bacteroidota bacterium]
MKHFDQPRFHDTPDAFAHDLLQRRKKQQRENLLSAVLFAFVVTMMVWYVAQYSTHHEPSVSQFSTSHVFVAR